MRRTPELPAIHPSATPEGAPPAAPIEPAPAAPTADVLCAVALTSLDDDKAEDIRTFDVRGRSSVADVMIVASGRSARHVKALAERVIEKLREAGARGIRVEGLQSCDWVLVDAGDLIIHLFRPEVRHFYAIERIWAPGPQPV